MLFESLPLLLGAALGPAKVPADTVAVLNLDEIVISASVADVRRSSLRLTDIGKDEIRRNTPGRTFPELIRNVPGIYSTSETGSFGDAKINIRGFKQENISVLLNGIPISGLTSGSMYWNNWLGLAGATSTIQIQKGIGNSMLSDNSVGGTLNILTMRPDPDAFAEAGYSHTGYGTNSAFFSLNSGTLPRGWAYSLLGSYHWGSSYVDCSSIDSWAYSAVLTKRLDARNTLNFTALGSPERHAQRSQRLTYDEMERHGIGYNKSWGWFTAPDGSRTMRTTAKNFYFKPYFTLTHSYDGRTEGKGIRILTTLYGALARGGGYFSESTGRRIASFLSSEGQLDWDAVYDYNRAGEVDGYGLRARNIMTDYLAGHTQYGLKSSVVSDLNERIQVEGGLHYQRYKTWERERITDLLGADYWYEDYAAGSLAGPAGRDPVKRVGDDVRLHNGRVQHYSTLYLLGTWKAGMREQTILTLGLSTSGTLLRRWDAYNYPHGTPWSAWTGRAGGSVKMGVLHKATDASSFYFNAAMYSRAPYASVFFPDGNNTVAKDMTNEKNYLGELGYRRVGNHFGLEATFYAAWWQDKTLLSAPYKSQEEEPWRYMVKGLDAFHFGGELTAHYRFSPWLKAEAFASVGQWKWKNDVEATVYDPSTGLPIAQTRVYADGLHVGDAPQTQLGAVLTSVFLNMFTVTAEWNYNDRLWADFDPVQRNDPDDRSDPFRIPAYHLVNLSLSWSAPIADRQVSLFMNLNNLLDARYLERSKDGQGHDKTTVTGYWGNGRNVNFGIRLRL